MSDQEITLLLVGRTGHGKSSTGNSILGEKVFPPRGVTSDVTDPVQEAKCEINGKTLRIVDGSNIGETDDEYPDNAKEIISLSDEAFKLCNKRFSALVLLLKYGIRFTKQERDAVLVIKSLFGSDVIHRHGVIVMTGGDHFARDAEDNGITFHQWCDQQTGDVHKLMKECGQRIVLFDNRTKNVDILRTRREELIAKVEEVLDKVGPYTEEDWERAEQGRRKLLVMTMMPQMEEETNDFIEDMTKKIDLLRASEATDPSGNLKQIPKLLGQLQQFEERLKLRDECTGSVTSLIERLGSSRITLTMMYDRMEEKVHGREKSNDHYPEGGQGTGKSITQYSEDGQGTGKSSTQYSEDGQGTGKSSSQYSEDGQGTSSTTGVAVDSLTPENEKGKSSTQYSEDGQGTSSTTGVAVDSLTPEKEKGKSSTQYSEDGQGTSSTTGVAADSLTPEKEKGKSSTQYSEDGQGTSSTTGVAADSLTPENEKNEEHCCCLTCCCCCLSCNQKCDDRYCCLACLFSCKVFCIRQWSRLQAWSRGYGGVDTRGETPKETS